MWGLYENRMQVSVCYFASQCQCVVLFADIWYRFGSAKKFSLLWGEKSTDVNGDTLEIKRKEIVIGMEKWNPGAVCKEMLQLPLQW